jgi:hypothetical protein
VEGGTDVIRPDLPDEACQTCGHVDFVHGEAGSRRCLYYSCSCERFDGEPGRADRRPVVLPLILPLVATKGSSIITAALGPREALARAEALSRAGWNVDLGKTDARRALTRREATP